MSIINIVIIWYHVKKCWTLQKEDYTYYTECLHIGLVASSFCWTSATSSKARVYNNLCPNNLYHHDTKPWISHVYIITDKLWWVTPIRRKNKNHTSKTIQVDHWFSGNWWSSNWWSTPEVPPKMWLLSRVSWSISTSSGLPHRSVGQSCQCSGMPARLEQADPPP